MNNIARQTFLAIGLIMSGAGAAAGQTTDDIIGTWTPVENVNFGQDGKRSEPFGPGVKGQAIFTSNGRFSLFYHRPELPKFAANNRMRGSDEENKAVVQGIIAFYGTYVVADKTVRLKLEGSSFPNWIGTEQSRPVRFNRDEMVFDSVVSASGGSNTVRFMRVR